MYVTTLAATDVDRHHLSHADLIARDCPDASPEDTYFIVEYTARIPRISVFPVSDAPFRIPKEYTEQKGERQLVLTLRPYGDEIIKVLSLKLRERKQAFQLRESSPPGPACVERLGVEDLEGNVLISDKDETDLMICRLGFRAADEWFAGPQALGARQLYELVDENLSRKDKEDPSAVE